MNWIQRYMVRPGPEEPHLLNYPTRFPPFVTVLDDRGRAALVDGRASWLAGLEEPDAGRYLRAFNQRCYEEGFDAEIHDCVDAVSAYVAEGRRRQQSGNSQARKP